MIHIIIKDYKEFISAVDKHFIKVVYTTTYQHNTYHVYGFTTVGIEPICIELMLKVTGGDLSTLAVYEKLKTRLDNLQVCVVRSRMVILCNT